MRRFLVAFVVALGLLVVGPPLFYAIVGSERPPLPPAEKLATLPDGRELHYIEAGSGPPVLLAHGLPGVSWDWKPTIQALAARGFRAISLDRAGYGHSDPRSQPADYTYASNGADLVAFLEALGLRDVIVAGWSYGGGSAIRAARRDPSRIKGIVLVASAGPLPEGEEAPGPPPLVRVMFSPPVLAWIGRVPPLSDGLRRSTSTQAFSEQPIPDWWLPQLSASLGQRKTQIAWVSEGRNAPPPWSDLDPSDLRTPTLVIHGTEDRFVPFEVGELLHDRATGSTLVRVEGGSHMLPVTHPEVLADAIAEFAAGS